MKKKAVTITSVANLAGVSVTTASRVINNKEYVSPETRRKVEVALAKLNYSPDQSARVLRGMSSKLVALIIPDILNVYYTTLAKELMNKVDLVIATGGGAMVRSAYSSGTPAYGVGAGNAVVIVDESADLPSAAEKTFKSKTFDNATSCSSENAVILLEGIYDEMVEALKKVGGYFCSSEERAMLKKAMWPDGVRLNKEIVAQPIEKIAGLADLIIPDNAKFLMVEGEEVSNADPFCKEKLSVVLTVWKAKTFDEAIEMVKSITRLNGSGHSCGIHTKNEDAIIALGEKVNVSRIMVNQPQAYGNSGNYDNGIPFTLTLGCGSWGVNITTENIYWKYFMNVTWISKPIDPVIPDEGQLFGVYWEKLGK